jgi:DNA-binding CsgD family transcriptional regulator/tetratricopeptide (TPR) repeat protein
MPVSTSGHPTTQSRIGPGRYDHIVELLEREDSLAQLESALDDAAVGTGRTVLVYGEAGIGKTRLVDEFLGSAQGRARVLWSACDDLITPPALGPFREISRQLGGGVSAAFAEGATHAELFSVVVEALGGGDRPSVLVVEDAQWADAASLDGLKFLGRRIGRLGTMLTVTFRDDEVPSEHPLRHVLGDLPPDTVRRIPLRPLSPETVAGLARRAGFTPDEVMSASQGNPFLLTELLTTGGRQIPASVLDSVSARLSRCSVDARALLGLLSVVPGRCRRELVEAAEGDAGEPLEECRERGLLEFDESSIWFRHELARRAAEQLLPAEQRRAVHGRVLTALIRTGADPARIVHHAEGAADVDTLMRFAPPAAREARVVGAHREALSHYRRIVPHLARFDPAEQADLLAEYAVECYLADDQPSALRAARRALELRRGLGDRRGEGELLRWLSRLHWWLGDPGEAHRFADEAVRALEALGPSAELAMAYSNASQLHMLAQAHEPAVAWANKAIGTARHVGDRPTLVHALNNLGSARLRAGDPTGEDLLLESLELARTDGLDEHAARALSNLSWTALDYRRYDRAGEYLEQGISLATDRDLAGYDYYLMAQRARLQLELGDWDLAETDALWVLGRPRSPGITTLPALTVLARIRSRRGDPDAESTLLEAWEAARAMGELQRVAPVAVARAEYCWLRGDAAGIAEAIEPARLLSGPPRQPWVSDEVEFWEWRAGTLDRPDPQAVEPFALQIAGDWQGAAAAWGRVGCPFEQAAALADSDQEQALLEALAIFERLGAVPAAALVRRRLRSLGASRIPRGPRRRTRKNPAGLTARQIEVLELVAAGLGNAEIAARLFVSPKTVEHHVSAIFTKLAVTDRRSAAEAAAALGIVTLER